MRENKVTDIAPEDLDRLGLLIEQGQFELLFWFFKMHGCAELIRRNLTESSQRRWRLRKMAMCWRFIRG